MKALKLLLVEDDTSLATTLKERLSKEGYSICWVNTLTKAREELKSSHPNLIILDVGLPDGSGFDLAKELQEKNSQIPFLFLTALASAPERLKGFELGAEEFIPKPFHLKELLLRVKHVLDAHKHVRDSLQKKILFHGYVIDFESYQIFTPDEKKISLSARDSGLLQLLINEKHRVVSRDEILDKLWGEEKFPSNRTIDNSIVRLRQSLGKHGLKAIKSIRSVGYRWMGEEGEFSGE
ncbi:MAG TPA: response regulator transcription factor [Leptospiraceae bacterium]|nr:response regulator transcription factor [Leptospiraceae bacterium]HMY32851.1 response regulator transcription factor [Leptospiraceae bacterium]HNA07030.1 response regulator transcription factor [Leptospiraceae bacterium]HNB99647.1 response regulator transcription factor [Leptospiraceae bacterium]HNC58043.1 response regulator transcription factor [Leptospiraceae bacterium]